MKLQAECDNRRVVRLSVRRALLAAAAAVAATQSPASFAAAPAADSELEEVVVTGSILRRTDAESPSPVTVLSSETLEERGINTVAEAVQRLTANNAGTITKGWNTGFNFASGATAPALRGLTVQSTLSISDGLRMAPYPLADDGQRNFVDLSSIPSAIIDRVEVLRDGASSTYGADAIAGVVNVITKKQIQGFIADGSYGVSQRGDADETRVSLTWGMGDLGSDGYNFYVSGEYQKQGELFARDRGFPYNTQNLQGICGPSGSCMSNGNWNGVTAEDGSFNGLISVPGVTLLRPITTATGVAGTGRFQYLNPAAGCREWPTTTITAGQSGTSPLNICEVDFHNAYIMLQPEIERMGLSSRFTANVGDNAQVYAMAQWFSTNTAAAFTPLGFNGTTPQPGGTTFNMVLPVYVCSTGNGTANAVGTGCDATNGSLNPYNPFAAAGQRAQVLFRSPYGREVETNSKSTRGVLGIDGQFSDGIRYQANFTASEVNLTRDNNNYYIPQRLFDVAARGTFNFSDPYANGQDVWDYIGPQATEVSVSKLWQLQGSLAKDLMDLAGGPLQAAIGASYREESINAPSGNPANSSAPAQRYFSINAVGTAGSRNVKSGFFEVSAPVLQNLEFSGSGRYDKYSTGQDNFSPKLGFKFKPVDMLAVRGTWSKGFRIPSFNEAFGLPTTGFVSRVVNCTTYAAFCAAHGNNAYATQSYSLGLTQTGNPGLDPEKSTSYTAGIVVEPMEDLSFTLDYWHIKVKGLITGVTDTSAVEAAYYANGGVVNIPGFNAVAGTPDVAFPNALPLLGFIETSYTNQDKQIVSGIDFGANWALGLGAGWKMRNTMEVSYLTKYNLITDGGDVLKYAGTLSPCNITSCSGAPKWRASLQNTFEYGDTTATITTYYTGVYDTASVDFGGVRGDCAGNAAIASSTASYVDGSPVQCGSAPTWNADLTIRHKLNDKVTIYGDVLNFLDLKAPFDHAAAYNLFNFNPAWAGPNILGRYFRIGAKANF
ncbi:MAG: TonB-dependent receptor [Proteobacteria bacterium]|jgi:iron complex outermembrane receptor protein|nr:TonB-dependent receptor [Pseudomonadota bacterium]MBK9250715.1 TonB-dependent receptor [Pseudomonadota bacterium]